jgi:hypothetical protein
MIDEGDCGAIGGMKIGRGNRSNSYNYFFSAGIFPGAQLYIWNHLSFG